MIVQNTGVVTPELRVLGAVQLPAFLVDAEFPAVIDAGMSCMADRYVREIRHALNGRHPARLFLTHTHYDHIGAAAGLKKAFPEMEICCSAAGCEVLKRPRAIKTIRELNREGAGYMEKMGEPVSEAAEFETFAVDRPISDGDTFVLSSGMHLQAIATPGHTRDAMSFYVPEKKMLFTGEAAGVMSDKGYIFSEWLADYRDYYASLQKLAALEIDVLCLGHGCVLTGRDAKDHMDRAKRYCLWFRELIESALTETGGDVEQARQRIKEKEYDPIPDPKQPEMAYLLNLDAKIRAVQRLDQQN
ncbi:MAG: MBL fold metallo-hydrolase [Desulfobacterales bacterium]